MNDASVQDVLDPTFAYTASSIRVDGTLVSSVVCPGGVCNEATIFNQVDGSGTAMGDGDAVKPPIDGDIASYDSGGKTIDFGDQNNSDNATLNVGADRVWAAVFTTVIQ